MMRVILYFYCWLIWNWKLNHSWTGNTSLLNRKYLFILEMIFVWIMFDNNKCKRYKDNTNIIRRCSCVHFHSFEFKVLIIILCWSLYNEFVIHPTGRWDDRSHAVKVHSCTAGRTAPAIRFNTLTNLNFYLIFFQLINLVEVAEMFIL